jgi:hypothetical protein
MKRHPQERPFRIDTRMQGGNAARLRFEEDNPPRLIFSADPKGGRPLWFYFRTTLNQEAVALSPDAKLSVILDHYETMVGTDNVRECLPVYMAKNQFWVRMSPGKVERTRDGRLRALWSVNLNADEFEFALCYPYGPNELRQLMDKLRGTWRRDGIGLSQSGREVRRVSNSYEHSTKLHSGIYLVAREHGCDMPAGWVLDGALQRLSSVKNNPFVTWAVALLDEDGAHAGATASQPDMLTGWCTDAGSRHEQEIVKQDVRLWRSACKGAFVVALKAAELRDTDGVYCEVPDEKEYPAAHAQAVKWAHVIADKLGTAYAAKSFVRSASGGRIHDWVAASADLPALTLCVPWCAIGDTVLSPKKYRDIGKLLADALIEKVR